MANMVPKTEDMEISAEATEAAQVSHVGQHEPDEIDEAAGDAIIYLKGLRLSLITAASVLIVTTPQLC